MNEIDYVIDINFKDVFVKFHSEIVGNVNGFDVRVIKTDLICMN